MKGAAGEAMGKHVIDAADGAGFLVNRCNRPFALEGLRLVEQRLATPDQVDRICRMAGGFKMGPFELMDLVGVDVGFTISKSFFEQSFGEPRWRPSPLAARAVAAGRHGRKAGEGWYRYPEGPPPDPEPRENELQTRLAALEQRFAAHEAAMNARLDVIERRLGEQANPVEQMENALAARMTTLEGLLWRLIQKG